MNPTNPQIKKANDLLKELCEHKILENDQILKFFENENEARNICELLKDKYLSFYPTDPRIGVIRSNDNTCNAVKNKLLDIEFKNETPLSINKQLKIIELIKGYWKLILIAIAIVIVFIKFWDKVFP